MKIGKKRYYLKASVKTWLKSYLGLIIFYGVVILELILIAIVNGGK